MILRFPFESSSSHLENISEIRLIPPISFSLISIPNFFRSFAIDSFFKSKAADSVKNYKTPLLSPKSPNSPLAFLEVEELKHFSSISRT